MLLGPEGQVGGREDAIGIGRQEIGGQMEK